jgi:uncharacterized membrane protein YgdD (TMEM256/DUF423 family)
MPANVPLAAGAVFGLTGVVMGALGAHGLAGQLSESGLDIWDTAVLYHLTHALALVVVGVRLSQTVPPPWPVVLAGWGFGVGILLFSGSLYVLALGGPPVFGPLTPLGGLALCAGWVALLAAARR